MRFMKTSRSLPSVSFVVALVAVGMAALFCKPGFVIAQNAVPANRASGAGSGGPGQAEKTSPAQEATQKKVPMAGDAFMNIQVLKDIPSNELMPSMRYITAALGVECNFCHDPKNFENDDKPEKNTARNMMKMMFAINKDNFNGRREVTCYTCHRGASRAANMPMLTAAGTMTGSPAGMPAPTGAPAPQGPGPGPEGASGGTASAATAPNTTVDAILAKYTDALGGPAATQKVTSIDEKGTIELPGRGGQRGMNAQAEILRKAPDKALVVVHLPNGAEFEQGYNGTAGWQQPPGHSADDLSGDDLVRARLWASFIPGLSLKQEFSRAQVAGTDKIADRDAYRVIASRAGGGQVRFYFDTQSGLLLRISERIESPLGALPEDTDYSDYRDVSGVKLPFTIVDTHVEGPTVFKWDQIQVNVPADDARFEKPAAKASQP